MKKLLCKEQTNCPNCGAVITGNKCEYCGTIFEIPTENDELRDILIEHERRLHGLYDHFTEEEKFYCCRNMLGEIVKIKKL